MFRRFPRPIVSLRFEIDTIAKAIQSIIFDSPDPLGGSAFAPEAGRFRKEPHSGKVIHDSETSRCGALNQAIHLSASQNQIMSRILMDILTRFTDHYPACYIKLETNL